jgi:glycosyltransferase involved in cell wall biosynthesis
MFWNLKEWLAFRQADRIITTSEFSKERIIYHKKLDARLVHVIPAGVGEAFHPADVTNETIEILNRYKILPGKFLLYVGGISPHKNLLALARVFRELKKDATFGQYKLVLAGDYESDSFLSSYSEVRNFLEQSGLRDEIVFTGYITDSDLAHLYRTAILFVSPSLEEGFGLPPVEAMACGTPVVSSTGGSLPEIIGEAGEFFDPRDAGALLHALQKVLMDAEYRQKLRLRGLERSKLFTWERAASMTLAIFDSM